MKHRGNVGEMFIHLIYRSINNFIRACMRLSFLNYDIEQKREGGEEYKIFFIKILVLITSRLPPE